MQNTIYKISRELEISSLSEYNILSGTAGIVLSYAYLYKIFQEDIYHKNLSTSLNKTLEIINEQSDANFSFGYGLAGLGWVLQELNDLSLIDVNDLAVVNLDDLDVAIAASVEEDIAYKNYDFFSGIIGKGIYFLKRYQATYNPKFLEKIIDVLKSIIARHNNHFFFIRYFIEDNKRQREINFGLAHGLPSIISFLTMVHQADIKRGEISDLLVKLCDFIVEAGITRNGNIMYSYSDRFYRKNPQSLPIRLGWCYGDLGIAVQLLAAGQTLNIIKYEEIGSKIASQTMNRTNFFDCQIMDASICHGSAGIALIFHHLFELTGRKEFEKSSAFWSDASIQLCNHQDGVGGYMFWKSDDNYKFSFKNEYGFLEGAAGVALSLLIRLFPQQTKTFDWHHLLLLPKMSFS